MAVYCRHWASYDMKYLVTLFIYYDAWPHLIIQPLAILTKTK